MDPNTVILEISSDDEIGWENHDYEGIDGINDVGYDHNWIAELLDEVNRDDCGYNDGGGDDSDEVVVVSEIVPVRKSRKKSKTNLLIDLDDDCVVLDCDPDKSMAINRDDNLIAGEEDVDSDDLVVVSEKGQVACRDYPHPRHLCIKFPFSSTPNQSHCHQCYCYVCDSLAPCLNWGNGNDIMDHCLATDRDEFWKLKRRVSKKETKPVVDLTTTPFPHTNNRTPLIHHKAQHNPVTRPSPIRACPYGVPNIISQNKSPFRMMRKPRLIRTNNIDVAASEPEYRSNAQFDFSSSNFQPQPQVQTFVPNYSIPCVPEDPVYVKPLTEDDGSNIDPKFFCDMGWPASQTSRQSGGLRNDGSGSVGYDDWGLECEVIIEEESMEASEFSDVVFEF